MTTRRARSGRPRARSASREADAGVARVAEQGDAPRGGHGLAVQPAQLVVEQREGVALGGVEVGPGHEVADVAGGHAEGVGHDGREVAAALAVEDAGQRRQDEAVGSIVGVQAGSQVQHLGQRARVEGQRDFGRDGGAGSRPSSRAADGRLPGAGATDGSAEPGVGDDRGPGRSRATPPRRRTRPGAATATRVLTSALRGRIDLGRGQDVGEGVEVVAGADAALGAGLQRSRAAAAEGVQDHVAGAGVAGDEGVGQAGREAGQVRAHGVEAVAPEPLLVLPLGGDGQVGQRGGELQRQGQLAVGLDRRGGAGAGVARMPDRPPDAGDGGAGSISSGSDGKSRSPVGDRSRRRSTRRPPSLAPRGGATMGLTDSARSSRAGPERRPALLYARRLRRIGVPVAQWIERPPSKRKVGSSSLPGGANKPATGRSADGRMGAGSAGSRSFGQDPRGDAGGRHGPPHRGLDPRHDLQRPALDHPDRDRFRHRRGVHQSNSHRPVRPVRRRPVRRRDRAHHRHQRPAPWCWSWSSTWP